MKVDLQVHTVGSSDSTLTVPALFERAAAAGLAAVAITDHDTVDAIAEGTQAAAGSGVSLVPGIEVSTSFRRYMAHALVYSDTVDNFHIREFLDVEVYQAKRQYTSTVIEALATAGVPISLQAYDEEAERSGKGGSPLERALQRAGVIAAARDYDKRIAPLIPPAIVRYNWAPPLERCVSVAHECGAVVILAHCQKGGPYGELSESELDEVRRLGVDGLEGAHPDHSPSQQRFLEAYARQHRLLITGGSDCHGPGTNPLGEAHLQIPERPLPPVIHLRDLLDNPATPDATMKDGHLD